MIAGTPGRIGPGLLLCMLAMGGSEPARPQQAEPVDITAQDSTATEPGNTLVPLPVMFYMPETGFGFGAVASYYFYPGSGPDSHSATRVQPSTVSAILIYTAKKQTIIQFSGELYPAGGDYLTRGTIGYSKFPNTFWGIGNDAPDEAEEDFTPVSYELSFELQRQVGPGWYAGLVGQAAYRRLDAVADGGLLATRAVPGTSDGRIVGLGVSLTRDTRDNTVFPRSGNYHQLSGRLYDGALGSEYQFASITADLRRYTSPGGGHVLALRVLGQGTVGTAPFDRMPQLGGDALLRGYFGGRFRDQDLIALQAEYRMRVWWRFGAVGFVSAGQVAPRIGDLGLDRFKPAAGAGLRILLSPEEGLNIRADYGWGFAVNSSGFYLSIGEVF